MKALYTAFAACLWIACVSDAPPQDIGAAKALWHAQEPSQYGYSVREICFCPIDTVHVIANRDSVLSAVATRLGPDNVPLSIPNPQHYSIDSLFARLEAMRESHPYKLRYHFDPDYGFPDTVEYDGAEQAVDDELTQTVFRFQPSLTR